MTALKEYQRLEAVGIWRENPKSQRHNVVVSLGDATIVVMDMQSRPLTHWSIPAVERANPGVLPAIYHPDGDPSETLEIAEDEIMMIEAIEKLRSAIDPVSSAARASAVGRFICGGIRADRRLDFVAA